MENSYAEQDLGRVVGPDGKSAYMQAKEGGYNGTEAQFADVLSRGTLCTYLHTRAGTIHTLTGAGDNIRFKAAAGFTAGDSFTVNGTAVTARTLDGAALSEGCFAAGSTVLAVRDGDVLTLQHQGGKEVNPNLLINGDFNIWQRGEVAIWPAGYIYTADMWKVSSNVANPVVKRHPTGGAWFEYPNDTHPVGAQCNFSQLLEDSFYQQLSGKTVTFSYQIDGEITTNTYTMNSATTPAITIKKNKVLQYAKLELGNRFTGWVPVDPATELMRCQRYYQVLGRIVLGSVYHNGDINYQTSILLPVKMRAVPYVTGEVRACNPNQGNTVGGYTASVVAYFPQIVLVSADGTGWTGEHLLFDCTEIRCDASL